MDRRATRYICAVIISGGAVLLWGLSQWHPARLGPFFVYLFVTVAASSFKVRLPGVTGTMSVFFIFQLMGVLQLPMAETLLTGIGASAVQCLWHAKKRPTWVQVAFNLASTSLAVAAAYEVYYWPVLTDLGVGPIFRLILATTGYFVLNTGPVAGVIAVTEGKTAPVVWRDCYFWCFPYYLVGGSLAAVFDWASRKWGLET